MLKVLIVDFLKTFKQCLKIIINQQWTLKPTNGYLVQCRLLFTQNRPEPAYLQCLLDDQFNTHWLQARTYFQTFRASLGQVLSWSLLAKNCSEKPSTGVNSPAKCCRRVPCKQYYNQSRNYVMVTLFAEGKSFLIGFWIEFAYTLHGQMYWDTLHQQEL